MNLFFLFSSHTTRKLINTNGNTEGIFSSVNFRGILPTEIYRGNISVGKKFKTKQKKMMTCHFYRRNYSLGNKFTFYYQRIYRRSKNYRQKIHRRSISVGDFVGKLITDGICVLRWRKNSVGKTVKSCSVFFTRN
jgi:hypothetical protein